MYPANRVSSGLYPPVPPPTSSATPSSSMNARVKIPERQSLWMCLKRNAHSRCLCLTFLINLCLLGTFWCQLDRMGKIVAGFDLFDDDLSDLLQDPPAAAANSTSDVICDEGVMLTAFVGLAVLYIVYIIECWHSTTRLILIYRTTTSNVYRYIDQMRQAQPIIWWKAACYHHVRQHRPVARYQSGRSRSGSIYSTTGVHYCLERINTHMAGSYFAYNNCGCRDISKELRGLELFPITRVYFSKGFSFANDQSAQEFDAQRTSFFRVNENFDHFLEIREGLDLVGVPHLEYMVCSGDPNHVPWYATSTTFWLFSIVLLSWPLRLVLEYNTAYVQYQVVKLFGTNYEQSYRPMAAPTTAAAAMSRTSTLESLSNYMIAPSYSETMLAERVYCLRSCSQTAFHENRLRQSTDMVVAPTARSQTKVKASSGEMQPCTSSYQAKLDDDDDDAEENGPTPVVGEGNQTRCDVIAPCPRPQMVSMVAVDTIPYAVPPPTYDEVIEDEEVDDYRPQTMATASADEDSLSTHQFRFVRTVDYMHQLLNVLRARMRRSTFPRSLTDKDFFQKLFDSPLITKQWKSLNEISNV